MSSNDWSYTVHHDFQAACALGRQPHEKAMPLGQWSAGLSASRPTLRLQRVRYAGQAAAVLLGVVGVCSVIAQLAFG